MSIYRQEKSEGTYLNVNFPINQPAPVLLKQLLRIETPLECGRNKSNEDLLRFLFALPDRCRAIPRDETNSQSLKSFLVRRISTYWRLQYPLAVSFTWNKPFCTEVE
jgi:hypothetical protein